MTLSNPRCYFDISIGNVNQGRIVMEIFSSIVPKTANNFLSLCRGDLVSDSGIPLTYKSSSFHRIIKGFMCQAGDFTKHDGTGGLSIYGNKFDDEDFSLLHDKAGLLSMANAGPNTNGSQFFITTAPTPHLNGKHVVFGKVINGMNVVRTMEHTEKEPNDKPVEPVKIVECGVLLEGESDGVPIPADGDAYPDYVEDFSDSPEEQYEKFLEIATKIKEIGSAILKKGLAANDVLQFRSSQVKFLKAIRYLEAVDPSPQDTKDLPYEWKRKFFSLKIACLSNHSLASMKLEEWDKCKKSAERVIEIGETLQEYSKRNADTPLSITNSDNAKAYLRAGI